MQPKATPIIRALSLVLLLCASVLIGQNAQIRTRVDLVVVPVSVKTSDNQVATGLTKENFAVYEDGQKQTIADFSIDPVPVSAAVLIDTGLSSMSFDKVRPTFPALAEAFSDFDEVTLYRFDKFLTKLLDFTSDRTLVAATLKELEDPATAKNATMISGPFSALGPVINGIPVIPGGPQPVSRATAPDAKLLHDAIFAAADALSARQTDRRKIILIVSDGRAKGDEHSFDETVDRLLDRGIQVFAIGIDQAFLSRRFSALSNYATQTGGDACFLNSARAAENCYAKSAEQARNQYLLAYVSNNRVAGQLRVFRKLRVEMVDPGLSARHKKGYFQYP